MAYNIGFTYYDEIPYSGQTTEEILASLTGAQKTAVLLGFVERTPATELKHRIGVHTVAIEHLYGRMDEIEERCRTLMRGEEVIDPGDPGADPPVPPTYNTPPATSGELTAIIIDEYSDEFTAGHTTAILTKMVQYSKHDGTGNWAYYSAEIIK